MSISLHSGVPKTATIRDVARATGLSTATISRVFSGDARVTAQTREVVLKAAQELRFEPNLHAQRLASGRCDSMIGLFSLTLDLSVGTRQLQLLQRQLQERGFIAPIYGFGYGVAEDEAGQIELLAELRRQKPRAIVASTFGLTPRAIAELERFQGEGGAVVCYQFPVEARCDCVSFDLEDGSYRAARHLLELGHRKLGLFFEAPRKPYGPRLEGFARALGEWSLQPRDEWLLHGRAFSDYEASGALLAEKWLQMPREQRPTGVCIINDYCASAFVNELMRAGIRVPYDVSVVGCDDLPVARHCIVPLSTVAFGVEAMIQQVLTLLERRLTDATAPLRHICVPNQLMARQSSAAPSL